MLRKAGFSSRPGAMALMGSSQMLVHGETTLSIVNFLPFLPSGPLFMGFGFIPFDKVIQTSGPNEGLADTTVPPGYFYQVKDTPFGGTLPIMINYPAATKATFKMKTDQGDIYTGFDMNVTTSGPVKQQDAKTGGFKLKIDEWKRGDINGGGAEMTLKTYNGDIYIRKKPA